MASPWCILKILGRRFGAFRLGESPERVTGRLFAIFDERLIEALHVVERLVRSPRRWRTCWRPRVPWRSNGPARSFDARVAEA
jgi:hypothetical protein